MKRYRKPPYAALRDFNQGQRHGPRIAERADEVMTFVVPIRRHGLGLSYSSWLRARANSNRSKGRLKLSGDDTFADRALTQPWMRLSLLFEDILDSQASTVALQNQTEESQPKLSLYELYFAVTEPPIKSIFAAESVWVPYENDRVNDKC